jgi:crotonobetainyl-CoA:carnitine CoA-transferase CaiB-like acyl-CoA transferase
VAHLPTATPPPPLAGVRVLDFTRLLPGPACTQILAEFGAEVIRVEDASRADGGDFLRPLADDERARAATFGRGQLYRMINRGKRSIALNLKTSEGQAIARALAAHSQVLVEGFRPGVMSRLGLGQEALLADTPSLVYCSISGYGQSGPWAHWAGHDINYLALTGVLEQNRAPDGRPILSSVQWADLASGALNAVIAILAALLPARTLGVGRHLDIAMAQGLYGLQASIRSLLDSTGQQPPAGQTMLTGGVASYQVYATLDGRWLAVGALEPHFWAEFCRVLECPDLLEQGLVGGVAGQRAIARVASLIGAQPLAHWLERFAGRDCCVTPVLSLAEAATHGPYPRQSDRIFPISLGGDPLSDAPECGADGAALLAELGYDSADIDGLVRERALRLPAGHRT